MNHNQQSTTPQSDALRAPIYATDVEMAVLGALIVEGGAFDEVSTILSADMFYHPAHMDLYTEIAAMKAAGKAVDLYTLGQRIVNTGKRDRVGGMEYLISLTQTVGSAAHVAEHAKIVADTYTQRQLIDVFNHGLKMLYGRDDALDVMSAVDARFAKLLDISAGSVSRMGHVKLAVTKSMRAAEARAEKYKKGEVDGITTGIGSLDNIIGSLEGGDLVILAARPSVGKTAVMLHMCKSAAESGTPVCIFSLEMNDVKLADRLLLSRSNVSSGNFKRGRISNENWEALEAASTSVSRMPIHIDDNPMASLQYIRASALKLKKKGVCGMIAIDYLQLINPSKSGYKSREQEISELSRGLKLLAKELDIPILLLSQLSRDVERRSGSMIPRLSDLRESGAIEQDADVVVFVHRPEYYKVEYVDVKGLQISTKGYGELHVAKARNGGLGVAQFNYNYNMTQISDFDADFKSEVMPF